MVVGDSACRVEQCPRPDYARNLCEGHYARWRKHGDDFNRGPIGMSRRESPEDRFFARVEIRPAPLCWPWMGQRNQFGYGQFKINKKYVTVHRFSYELLHGKIPDGYEIDHICWTPWCVNPAHLRLATRKQNLENPSGLRVTNTSGVQGVSWDPEVGLWRARVGHNHRRYHVGRFDNLADAEAAVIAKRNELFTHNNLDKSAGKAT